MLSMVMIAAKIRDKESRRWCSGSVVGFVDMASWLDYQL